MAKKLQMDIIDFKKEINKCINDDCYFYNNYVNREGKNLTPGQYAKEKMRNPHLYPSIDEIFVNVRIINKLSVPDGRVMSILMKSIKENKNIHVVYSKPSR